MTPIPREAGPGTTLGEPVKAHAGTRPRVPPSKPASRPTRPAATLVSVGVAVAGDPQFTLIAGGCSVENRNQLISTAESVPEHDARILRAITEPAGLYLFDCGVAYYGSSLRPSYLIAIEPCSPRNERETNRGPEPPYPGHSLWPKTY